MSEVRREQTSASERVRAGSVLERSEWIYRTWRSDSFKRAIRTTSLSLLLHITLN